MDALKASGFLTVLLALAVLAHHPHHAHAAEKQKVRPPGVAGSFYPADPAELTKMVDGFLAKAEVPQLKGPLVAVVSPHAGYPFSGPVAAYSYALLRGRKFARVVVIAPSHYVAFPFNSIYDGDAYSTPLGQVPVDKEFAAKLPEATAVSAAFSLAAGVLTGRKELFEFLPPRVTPLQELARRYASGRMRTAGLAAAAAVVLFAGAFGFQQWQLFRC